MDRRSSWLGVDLTRPETYCPDATETWTKGLRKGHCPRVFLPKLETFLFSFSQFSVSPSVQFSCSVVSNSLRPHESQTPGLPVRHQLPELTQTHMHRVSDAIQPSHPLLSPSPPAPKPSQHQSLFQWVNSLHEMAKVLEFLREGISFFSGMTERMYSFSNLDDAKFFF